MHCLFILFLATIVPVSKAVRNYQFQRHEFSKENKNCCPRRDWLFISQWKSQPPRWRPLGLCGFQLQVTLCRSSPRLPVTFCSGTWEHKNHSDKANTFHPRRMSLITMKWEQEKERGGGRRGGKGEMLSIYHTKLCS